MNKSIGSLEFKSICKGIEVSNEILKAHDIEILYFKSICPGKFIVVFSGDAENVKQAVEQGKLISGKYLVESFTINRVHNQIVEGLKAKYSNREIDGLCFGVMETTKVCSGIKALDVALKSSEVNLFKIQLAFAIGGKLVFIISGSVSSVENAILNARNSIPENEIVNTSVMPFVEKALMEKL